MSYSDLLTDHCDIYNPSNEVSSTKYGVPGETILTYTELPSLTDVPCYFTLKNQSLIQYQPNQEVVQTFLVHFEPTVNIMTNAKLVWNGITLKAKVPRLIKNHHIEVEVYREDNL